MRDAFQWRAYYGNDSWLDEYGESPCEQGEHPEAHGWVCIDHSRLTGLAWLAPDFSIWARVEVKPGATAILFRRRIIADVLATLGDPVRSTIHVIGWQRTEWGRNSQWLLAIMPDNRVVVTDDSADLR